MWAPTMSSSMESSASDVVTSNPIPSREASSSHVPLRNINKRDEAGRQSKTIVTYLKMSE
jgi:hypothetical protein